MPPESSNVTFQDLSSLLQVSGNNQRQNGGGSSPSQPVQQSGQTPGDVSNSPVLGVRGTHYGYQGDPNTDPNSRAGIGAWDNQLQDGISVGLSPDVEARLGVQPNEELLWTGQDGTQRRVTFHDRTASDLRGRVDFYDKSGQIGDLGEGTIQRLGSKGPAIPMLETSDTAVQSQPASFGMRVASPRDVQDFNNYVNNGGDVNQIPIYDQLAVAIAKDPQFLSKPENFEAFYGLVYKPLQQQSGGEALKKFLDNIGPTIGDTVNNLKEAALTAGNDLKDQAELAYRKATGQTQDQGYQDLLNRLGQEQATMLQGGGRAISDAWDFVTGTYNGLIQITKPLAMWTMGRDPKSADEIDRKYAQALQQTVGAQQKLHNLGDQVQQLGAQAYQATGVYADLGQKVAAAQPNQAAVSGVAIAANPLNFVGLGVGEDVVGAFKPLFFGKASQAAEELAGASARKLALDSTQILPENPELSAARPGYIPTRNAQASAAPIARQAAQDVTVAQQNLADRLTSLNKIAGDPGTVTWFAQQAAQATGATANAVGGATEALTAVPEWLAGKLSGGNEAVKGALSDAFQKYIFGSVLHHFGPVGAAAETFLEHAPKVAQSVSDIAGALGQELKYGETTVPLWTRVAQQTKYVSKGMASFLDSPAIQTAQSMAAGGAAGAATGAALGGLQAVGSGQSGTQGFLSGAMQGGIFGMAGGGFGQWMKFRDPNQYLLQARGDWKRYRDMLSPAERNNFAQLSSTNQLMLAQHAQQFPDLRVQYVNDPNGPKGFHYFDEANRSNIQINLAAPDSVIRATLAHELIHGATTSGVLPEVMDTLFGNPERGQLGQYTALDTEGKPLGPDLVTGRYLANQDFANLKNQYLTQMTQAGLPTAHLNDISIAKEIYAEHGVDYLMSGGALLDSSSAFRPGMFSQSAMKTALAKIGYTFDGNGRMIGAPGGTISGTGLFNDLQRNPDLMRLARTYFQKGVQEGALDSEEQSTRRFTRKDMQNPNVAETWLQNDPSIIRDEKGSVIRNPLTGEPAYRTAKEVKEYNAKLADAMRRGVEALPESERMNLGYRETGANSFFVRYLPESLLDSLAKTNEYNPHQIASLRMLSRVLGDAGNPGMEMRMFYRKALTPGKRYGSYEGTEKFAVPYGFEVSGQNNVNIKSVDFNQLGNNFLRMKSRAPFKGLWQSVSDFDQDAHTYFTNHSNGQPGATGIGEAKRDAINALAGFGTVLHRESNPLVDRMPNSVRPIIKDYSIDRANQISATGGKRPFLSEDQYHAMNRNYLPGAAAGAPGKPMPEAAAPPDQTVIPVTMTTTRTGKTVPEKIDYGITSAPLVEDKQPPGTLPKENNFGHVDFLTKPDQQKLTHLDKVNAVTDYADKLVDEFGKWKDNKDVVSDKNWYDAVRKDLKKGFGNHAELFAHLLAATSPQQGVVQNWADALEAYRQYRLGRYDDAIGEFKRTGKITEDMKPTKANGAKFGANSDAVLKVLTGTWLDSVEGPKTPNFFENLFGRGTDATIDKWAARTMRRLGYDQVEGAPAQWRLQPKSETGVSNLDFAFSQQAFKQAAERLGLKPHQLQAILWYAEKHLWAEKGWAKGGAQAAKASYIPMLKAYAAAPEIPLPAAR